jgi:hypothetical protein
MPKADPNNPVHFEFIRLVTPPDDIAKRVKVEDVAKFSKDAEKAANEVLAKCKTPCKVLIDFQCTPSGHTVTVMHQPKDVDEEPLKEIYDALAKIDKLPVKEETVQFQIEFTVTPKKKPAEKSK